jgi:uncharacterized integral membrane protein
MTTLIILLALLSLVVLIFLLVNPLHNSIPYLFFAAMVNIILIFMALFILGVSSREFRVIAIEGHVIQYQLNNARLKEDTIAESIIMDRVIIWNTKLAEHQYQNSRPFIGDFIDDDIMKLKPIE